MRHLDPCTCGGTMRQYATKTKGRVRTRYLKCDGCKKRDVERFYVDSQGRPVFAPCVTLQGNSGIETALASPSIEVTTIAKGDHGHDQSGVAEH